jgi:hypothetical protein
MSPQKFFPSPSPLGLLEGCLIYSHLEGQANQSSYSHSGATQQWKENSTGPTPEPSVPVRGLLGTP